MRGSRVPAFRNRGFSLIEFMVAMVLGLILIGGAVSVYLASKRSYTEVEQVAALAEHGRFAMYTLNDSLRHAGFTGAANPQDVLPDGSLGGITGDCNAPAAAAEVANYLRAVSADADGKAFGCITDARPGTDVLVVKHVLPQPLYDADPDDPNAPRDGNISFPQGLDGEEIYVIANSERGLLLDGADAAPDVGEGNEFALGVAWPYRVQIYYVRDLAIPTLSRRVLRWNAGAMAMATEDLVPGVENMRVRFGLDSDSDGELDTYTDLDGAVGNWQDVEALELFLLLRSATEDPQHSDTKTYQLGDVTVTPTDDPNEYVPTARRLMVHNTISLRNPKLMIRGGG